MIVKLQILSTRQRMKWKIIEFTRMADSQVKIVQRKSKSKRSSNPLLLRESSCYKQIKVHITRQKLNMKVRLKIMEIGLNCKSSIKDVKRYIAFLFITELIAPNCLLCNITNWKKSYVYRTRCLFSETKLKVFRDKENVSNKRCDALTG